MLQAKAGTYVLIFLLLAGVSIYWQLQLVFKTPRDNVHSEPAGCICTYKKSEEKLSEGVRCDRARRVGQICLAADRIGVELC